MIRKMNTATKERQGCDVICQNHGARAHTERDLYRICPSKLSKRELEDLYFALLENNLELKKTIHSQQDKLKMLNTKLQRLTVTMRTASGKEKECGATKMIINEQKESILELKKANERMEDRIRVLNMRLCSAKQFLKRSPSQAFKCIRCLTATTTFKNSSMSALNTNPSASNMKMTSTSSQYLKKDETPDTNDAQSQTESGEPEVGGCEKQCNENKCTTQMDELKEKIVDLQGELSKAHREYTNRISKLEDDVSALNHENIRVRATSQHELGVNNQLIHDLKNKLNEAETSCNELALQLTIEKRKVAELETSLRLADISNQMAKTIDKLAAITQDKLANTEVPRTNSMSSCSSGKQDAPSHKRKSTSISRSVESRNISKTFGGTDLPHHEEIDPTMLLLNEEMSKRICELQDQLDNLRNNTFGENMEKRQSINFDENKEHFALEYGADSNDKKKQSDINSSNLEVELIQDDLTNDKDSSHRASEHDSSQPGSSRQPLRVSMNLPDNPDDDNDIDERTLSAISTYNAPSKYDSKNKSDQKDDDHNRFQIPGPIPVSPTKYKTPLKTNIDKKKKTQTDDRSVTIGEIENMNAPSNKFNDFVKDINKAMINQDEVQTEKDNAKSGPNKPKSGEKNIKSYSTNEAVKPNEVQAKKDNAKNEPSKHRCGGKNIKTSNSNEDIKQDKLKTEKDNEKTEASKHRCGEKNIKTSNKTNQAVKQDEIKTEKANAQNQPSKHSCGEKNIKTSNKPKSPPSKRSPKDTQNLLHEMDLDDRKKDGNANENNYALNKSLAEPDSLNDASRKSNEIDFNVPRNDVSVDTDIQTYPESKTFLEARRKTNEYKHDSDIPIVDGNNGSFAAPEPFYEPPTISEVLEYYMGNENNDLNNLTSEPNVNENALDPRIGKDVSNLFIGKTDSLEVSKRRLTNSKTEENMSGPDGLQQIQKAASSYADPSEKIPADFVDKADSGEKEDNDVKSQIEPEMDPQPTSRDSATYTKSPEVVPNIADFELDDFDRKVPYDVTNTYTLDKRDMATSPDSTDHEISSITEQPHEIFDTAARDVLSPGEAAARSAAASHTDYGSLSEGELPTSQPRKLSAGEKSLSKMSRRSSLQMEATLQALGRELQRCRQLLLHSRPQTNTERRRTEEVPLHRTTASRRLPYTKPHTCVFTLHIGTLVLSDEAVMKSRDKSLILMWKFYDQNVSMARLRPGRVILFDFCTQYDVPFSEDFLNYMKHVEMPLMICEINDQDNPIATCSLPLREALLHTNRRADMSLALVSKESHEELGVLDLWCALRAAPALRPRLAAQGSQSVASISENSNKSQSVANGNTPPDSREHSDTRLSQDIVFGSEGRRTHSTFPANRLWEAREPVLKGGPYPAIPTVQGSANQLNDIETAEAPRPYHRISTRKINNPENASQAHSSIGSMRNMTKYQHLQGPSKSIGSRAVADSLQELLNREKNTKNIAAARSIPRRSFVRDDDDFSYLKKENSDKKDLGGQLGMNKILDSVKKSVKYTDALEDPVETPVKLGSETKDSDDQSITITVLWLALNEECEAMVNPNIKRLYVAYSFLGRSGADLETPISLPKPKHYADKCYFDFKKTFELHDADLPLLGHMSRCRAGRAAADPRDCIVFSVVSEPPEDPLGLSSCEDIGYAYLYLGDILAYSAGSGGYTEVVPVRCAAAVCGVLAVRVAGLRVLRRCLALSSAD